MSFDPTWRTPTVAGLADLIYADRAFDRLPMLADPSKKPVATIPACWRTAGMAARTVRGCWVIDMLLGKG